MPETHHVPLERIPEVLTGEVVAPLAYSATGRAGTFPAPAAAAGPCAGQDPRGCSCADSLQATRVAPTASYMALRVLTVVECVWRVCFFPFSTAHSQLICLLTQLTPSGAASTPSRATWRVARQRQGRPLSSSKGPAPRVQIRTTQTTSKEQPRGFEGEQFGEE